MTDIEMSADALKENVERHFQAIDLCLANHLRMPALILVYCGIDIFASLGRPAEKSRTTSRDFIGWCENYLLPSGGIECSALDLYAARCGLVHSYSAESSLSESGEAQQIAYAQGNRSPEDLQRMIDFIGEPIRVIHIETLASSFKKGVDKFLSEAEDNSEFNKLLIARADNLFKDQPSDWP